VEYLLSLNDEVEYREFGVNCGTSGIADIGESCNAYESNWVPFVLIGRGEFLSGDLLNDGEE
jgi:hypothetical protein